MSQWTAWGAAGPHESQLDAVRACASGLRVHIAGGARSGKTSAALRVAAARAAGTDAPWVQEFAARHGLDVSGWRGKPSYAAAFGALQWAKPEDAPCQWLPKRWPYTRPWPGGEAGNGRRHWRKALFISRGAACVVFDMVDERDLSCVLAAAARHPDTPMIMTSRLVGTPPGWTRVHLRTLNNPIIDPQLMAMIQKCGGDPEPS